MHIKQIIANFPHLWPLQSPSVVEREKYFRNFPCRTFHVVQEWRTRIKIPQIMNSERIQSNIIPEPSPIIVQTILISPHRKRCVGGTATRLVGSKYFERMNAQRENC